MNGYMESYGFTIHYGDDNKGTTKNIAQRDRKLRRLKELGTMSTTNMLQQASPQAMQEMVWPSLPGPPKRDCMCHGHSKKRFTQSIGRSHTIKESVMPGDERTVQRRTCFRQESERTPKG